MAIAEPAPVLTPIPARAADAAAPLAAPRTTPRLAYLDALKVGLTILVILHHVGQAYGPTGGRWPIFNPERAWILSPFFGVNAAFFMGLFFLLSALFVPASFDRKGAVEFLRDRAVRFGVPLVLFAFGVAAPLAYLDYAGQGGALGFPAYLVQVYVGQWRVDAGHLWFLEHLLVYALIYAAWRTVVRPRPVAAVTPGQPPSSAAILGFALALAVVTFLVRIHFPIDRWVSLLGYVPAELAHLPQYAALFAVGPVAARRDWLAGLPRRTGLTWLAIGVTAAALRYLYSILGHLAGVDNPLLLTGGGLNVGSLAWSTWEAFICVGLCVGLPVVCRDHLAAPGRLLRRLAPNAFGAYVIHVLPVVGLQAALADAALPPLVKFGLVGVVAVPLCFLLAGGLRRLPGARAVL